MSIEKKIEILRKRNMELQEENDQLKKQIKEIKSLGEKYIELDELKKKWESEIYKMNQLRSQYSSLIDNLKLLSSVKEKIDTF